MPLFRDGDCPPLRRWSERDQIVFFAACALGVNLTIGILISPFGFTDAAGFQAGLLENHGLFLAYIQVLFAPFYETIIGQWLPMLAGKLMKKPPPVRIAMASVWFGLLHVVNGPASMIQAAGVGWIFACAFAFGVRRDFFAAYRITTYSHVLHNFVVFTTFVLLHQASRP